MDRVLRGGHLGDAWGSSPWTASTLDPATPTIVGSLNLFQPYDPFAETGSFFEGLQAGYNYLQRYFVRQTIDLGGATEKVQPDNKVRRLADGKPAGANRWQVCDRRPVRHQQICKQPEKRFPQLVTRQYRDVRLCRRRLGFYLWRGRRMVSGTWTVRGGIFDLSATPAGGISPSGGNLDSTFSQFQLVGEIEERHELWGQPGKLKVTGFFSRGRAGKFADAVELAALTGQPADINAVRAYTSRPGLSLNVEQQITETVGVFARAGWADGKVEPWVFTDIEFTFSGGVSVSGKHWGRPDDTVGIAGVVNTMATQSF